MKVENIPTEAIVPSERNPNVVPDRILAALREEITRRGFVQPVYVRPHPEQEGRFEVIDGEHRWRILGELGARSVPCVVDREISGVDADVRRLTMNRLRGEMVPIRLAHLLVDLSERIPESEIRERLAMTPEELRDHYSLAGQEPKEQVRRERKAAPAAQVEIAFSCMPDQVIEVEALLAELTDGDSEREAAVLSRLAQNWEPEAHG